MTESKDHTCTCMNSESGKVCCQCQDCRQEKEPIQKQEGDFLANVCAYDGPTDSCESCQ